MTDLRDYSAEMNAILSNILARSDDMVVSTAAAKLHNDLLERDPDLLSGWLRMHAVAILADAMSQRIRSRRGATRRYQAQARFSDAAQSGDRHRMSPFMVRHVVDDHHTSRPVGEMTGNDHLFVASEYDHSARSSAMLASFHRAVARRVGDRKTREVLDEESYARLYDSIAKRT